MHCMLRAMCYTESAACNVLPCATRYTLYAVRYAVRTVYRVRHLIWCMPCATCYMVGATCHTQHAVRCEGCRTHGRRMDGRQRIRVLGVFAVCVMRYMLCVTRYVLYVMRFVVRHAVY